MKLKYIVRWEYPVFEYDGFETPGAAAREARMVQLDPDSLATQFTVIDVTGTETVVYDIDLAEEAGDVSA